MTNAKKAIETYRAERAAMAGASRFGGIPPDLRAVIDAENGETRALQAMINAGQWSFQGSMGRSMMAAIDAGVCALGPNPATDYWGNRIPSRTEVKAGTKGSVQFVEARGNEVLE